MAKTWRILLCKTYGTAVLEGKGRLSYHTMIVETANGLKHLVWPCLNQALTRELTL